MNCRKFELRLERFLTGALSPASMRECREHLKSCVVCSKMLDSTKQERTWIKSDLDEGLVQAILEKTSGKGCNRAHELLPDHVDNNLAPAPRALIEQHLENCRSCKQIYETLEELTVHLPSLAEINPGDGFTAEFMRTVRRLEDRERPGKIRAGLRWKRLFARPRFAWEAAYVFTLLLFALLKFTAFIPGLSLKEPIDTLHAESAKVFTSAARTVKEDARRCGESVSAIQDRWTGITIRSGKVISDSIIATAGKTKQYWRNQSSAVSQLSISIWNGMVGLVDSLFSEGDPDTQ